MAQQCQATVDKLRRKRMEIAAVIAAEEAVNVTQTERSMAGRREDIPTIPEEEEPPEDEVDSQSTTEAPSRTEVPLKEHMDALDYEIYALEEDRTRERDALHKQRATLLDRCTKAERDLQMLKSEFEKNEDYWTLKLQEEQDYYEEERKLYDEKFSSLEAKIREYEELVLTSGNASGQNSTNPGGHDDHDRLSTIDESVVYEKQVSIFQVL